MLIYSLVGLTFIIWAGIYFLYFRQQVIAWFSNRFGKDNPAPVEDNAPEAQLPFSYTPPPKDDKS
ncbi:hypothetical protein AD931_10780 [Gluconobacter oxydans]|uniref:Uncharacterized protein n=1 Tax=Gluconobacter oxydans TaxID=442 RepID=A0AB34XES9_GLUOY|nr:hypothetical protein [Gluconobacter oxydans]KXV07128.1 hypothetical protein AD931_10780 [Gluconobacter oxydans]